MADELLTVLTKFHHEVVIPDIQRIVGDAVAPLALRNDMLSHFDAMYKRFDRLEEKIAQLESAR